MSATPTGHAGRTTPRRREPRARLAVDASGAAVLRALAEHLSALFAERCDGVDAAVRRIGRAAGAVCSATGEALVALAGPEDDAD